MLLAIAVTYNSADHGSGRKGRVVAFSRYVDEVGITWPVAIVIDDKDGHFEEVALGELTATQQ